jgi:hypothetical protein
MSKQDTAHAWWSRLRHQGLLLSPVVMLERFPAAPEPAQFHQTARLRDAYTRFVSTAEARQDEAQLEQSAILGWTDTLLENYVGHGKTRIASQHSIPENLTAAVRIGNKSDTIRPHRVVFADDDRKTPALLVMADTSHIVGRGRGRTAYSRFLELLRCTGHRLGLLTNGHQFRLVYAGLDFESWCEWESERWFDGGEGTEELNGLRQLVSPDALKPVKEGTAGLLDAVEESRKRQADLSSVLRENVRQAVELLLEEVSAVNRTNQNLFASLVAAGTERPLTDAEAHEALLQATVRVVMRLVVCLFAESRQLLPVDFPIYAQAYGVRSLYELLEETKGNEGGTHGLMNRSMAWPRLMALFRLIHDGSAHGAFALRPYGGVLFRPGDDKSSEPVARALHILEHAVSVSDVTIYHVLRKLLRGPLPVIKGKAKTFVEGPVDYTDLRTEFIGLIYEGLLDYKLKRTDEKIGPQVFLNLGREPVLPLSRLNEMLANDKKGLKDLLTTLRKEKVTASAATDEDEAEEEAEEPEEAEETTDTEVEVEAVAGDEGMRGGDYLDAVESAKAWAKEAVVLAGLVGKQKAKEPDSEYQARIDTEATKLIKKVVTTGEFYLVRAGNTRKGTGTFYTRPQLAVPTVHRTLEPLCYYKAQDSTLTAKTPEVILGLKVCDPACGSASFLVAALHYLADALYKSLCLHCKLDDPDQAKKVTLPYGRPRTSKVDEELVPFPPNDAQRGHTFEDRVKALLRRHVVERCIYGVDINSLAVEFARVSLWVETLDPELPFSFLDHKIKVGNSLVGCWLDRVLDYPLKAWEREGGDGKDGPRTQRIESFLKGEKKGNRRTGDGRIKQEMRTLIERRVQSVRSMFEDPEATPERVVEAERTEYERLHDLPMAEADERESYYRDHIERSPSLLRLKQAMDEWCATWFWPTDDKLMALVPTPLHFHEASADRAAVVTRLVSEIKFFHWELEFPDVFTLQRSGFDAMIGNPPWDVMKPNSQEFFTDFDPLYRTYDKQAALHKQKELFATMPTVADHWDQYTARFKAMANWARSAADPFALSLARGKEGTSLATAWAKHRQGRIGFADSHHPFRLQGSADLNLYKMFTEVFWSLLRPHGRLGALIPSGIYSDAGTQELRELFLQQGIWEWLYCFENKRRIFDIHGSFKFGPEIVEKQHGVRPLKTNFMVHSLAEWERADPVVVELDTASISLFSPATKCVAEIRSQRDLAIFGRVYDRSVMLFSPAPEGPDIHFGREFHMVDDSRLFRRREQLLEAGFVLSRFGHLTNTNSDSAFPLYQGRMTATFDPATQVYVSGSGRSAKWASISNDSKRFFSQFYMLSRDIDATEKAKRGCKIGIPGIARSTDQRTMMVAIIRDFPTGHSLNTAQTEDKLTESLALVAGVLNSLVYDFVMRCRLGGVNVSEFILAETPYPATLPKAVRQAVVVAVSRLNFIHARFAPDWLRLRLLYPELAKKEWKQWWAITEADRLRLRVEIDALCADVYGLDPDDFDWIVRDDPTDPKGFWRVDKDLPYRERLTGLAAAAFRALKAGKWTAEAVSRLSNDNFFEIIGVPEMTTGPDPLIDKRAGCHRWKPDEFGEDDPRHGWTWNDCEADARLLLGTGEAVERYVHSSETDAEVSEGQPSRSQQGQLF